MENINTVMKEVMDKLDSELDGSPEVLVAAGYFRKACTATARTVNRTMLPNMAHASLPNMAHASLEDDGMDCNTRVLEMIRAIAGVVPADRLLGTVLILASAVAKAAFKAN